MNPAETISTLRVPPHSLEAEQSVIGAVFSRPECFSELELRAEVFYRRAHKLIWASMQAVHAQGSCVDAAVISDRLRSRGELTNAGGNEYLAQLATMGTGANAKHYANIVRDRAIERSLIETGCKISEMGYSVEGLSVSERVAAAQALLTHLDTPDGGEPVQIDSCLRDAVFELERRHEAKGELLGLSTGFEALDARTQGLCGGDMILLAGRPSSGKTTLAMNIATNVALSDKLVIVFSLEMSSQMLTLRMLSALGRIPLKQVRSADLRDEQWNSLLSAVNKLKGRNLWLDETPTITSSQMLARANRIARKLNKRPALIVIDYLQLFDDRGESVERVSKISRNIKLAAKELDCPIIALSQLNRVLESRSDKRPILADLRDSGSLEQDADLVFMIYRDEIYNPQSHHKGIAEILCRKFRNGEIGEDYLAANLDVSRFDNLKAPVPIQSSPQKRSGGFQYEN